MDQLRERAARDTEAFGKAQDARQTLLQRLAACEAALGLQNTDAARPMGDASCRPPRIAHRPMARRA
jgi:hypothetical protein